MEVVVLIAGPALLAGAVAIGVTLAVERWGGVVGGLLGTLPTTIVPAALGMWFASPDPATYAAAMGAVPVGMLVDALFLYLWRVVPPRLPHGSVATQLAAMVGVSLAAWAVLASLAVVGLSALEQRGVAPSLVGGAALLMNVAVGVWACQVHVPAPRGLRTVGPAVLVARGLLAGLAIAVSTALAHGGDGFLAGLASVFPAIFLTTMVALWVAQGLAVPSGAVGPMMLGASSVGAFALLTTVTFPALGPAAGALLAWITAAALVTAPALTWLRLRRPG